MAVQVHEDKDAKDYELEIYIRDIGDQRAIGGFSTDHSAVSFIPRIEDLIQI